MDSNLRFADDDPLTDDGTIVGDNAIVVSEVYTPSNKVFPVNPVNLQVFTEQMLQYQARFEYRISTPDYVTPLTLIGSTTPTVRLEKPSAGYSVVTRIDESDEYYNQYLVAQWNNTVSAEGGPKVAVYASKTELNPSESALITVSGLIPDSLSRLGTVKVRLSARSAFTPNSVYIDWATITLHPADKIDANTPFSGTFSVTYTGSSVVGRRDSIEALTDEMLFNALLIVETPTGRINVWSPIGVSLTLLND